MIKFSLILAASFFGGTASTDASAAALAAPASFVCPVKHPVSQASITDVPEVIDTEMNKRFDAVIADSKRQQAKGAQAVPVRPVDPALMTALAQVTGCGALIDKEESCSLYFSPHVGSPLSIFMDLKKTNPLRKQFETAVMALPNKYEREAAQHCIKLTGKK